MADDKKSRRNREDDRFVRIVKSTAGDDITVRKNIMPVAKMNEVIQKMLRSVKSVPLVTDLMNKDKVDEFEARINDVLDKETERFVRSDSGANGKDIALFINSVLSTNPKGSNLPATMGNLLQNKNITELMNDQSSQINLVLSERYKNLNSLYEDIRLITEQLTELCEVIDTMRDTIVNSDNSINDISRVISFNESSDEGKAPNHGKNLETVYAMEASTHIKEKLKKVIIPETLKYGNFFVFTQPYSELFAKFKAMDDKFKAMGVAGGMHSAVRIHEAWQPTTESTEQVEAFYESYSDTIQMAADKDYTKDKFVSEFNTYLTENIEVIDDTSIPLMEDSGLSALADADVRSAVQKALTQQRKSTRTKKLNNNPQLSTNRYSEAIFGVNGDMNKAEEKYRQEFKEVTGVYMKLYDPRRVIPVYVMDFCIGYYLLYETMQHTTSNVLNAVHTLSRTSMLFLNDRKKEFENKLVALISDRICSQIDKKFLQKNAQFKEMIANAVQFDDFYKKSFRVQFVPANYMTHFRVNIDYNTHMGVSVLRRSIFYAMLYLTLLLFKIIMITTRSSDTRMFLIHTTAEDKDISGRINKVVSEFKQNQISYNDFGSVRGVLAKVGKGRDIAIPLGPGGDRAFDVEVMQGQQYDLDTPLMEMLKKGMISNTGCPSAMINFMDEVDYARQISQMHSKYVSRMISMQEETEDPTTELYRKLLRFGDYEIDDEAIDNLKFKWVRPRTLAVSGLTDMIGTTEQLTEFMCKIFLGENSQEDARIKDKYYKYLVTKIIMPGMFDWERIEEDLKSEALNLRADIKEEDAIKAAAQNAGAGDAGAGGGVQ